MTRQDFIENVNSWSELIDFCYDEDCDECENIYSEDSMDEQIDESLGIWIENYRWWDLKDILNDLPTDGDYFYCESSDTKWRALDDEDFENYKERVLLWMDRGEYWDEEYDEEDEYLEEENPPLNSEAQIESEDLVPIEDEDISVMELLSACDKELNSIKDITDKNNEVDDDAFFNFVASITVKKVR